MNPDTIFKLGYISIVAFIVTMVVMFILMRISEKKWAKIREEEKKK